MTYNLLVLFMLMNKELILLNYHTLYKKISVNLITWTFRDTLIAHVWCGPFSRHIFCEFLVKACITIMQVAQILLFGHI